MSTQGAEDDGAVPGNHNMNNTHDTNSYDIEQGHGAKSNMMHTDSIHIEGSSHTAWDITGENELLKERMYKSTAFRIWMTLFPLVIFRGLVFISSIYTQAFT